MVRADARDLNLMVPQIRRDAGFIGVRTQALEHLQQRFEGNGEFLPGDVANYAGITALQI